jgi:hypothetical protein
MSSEAKQNQIAKKPEQGKAGAAGIAKRPQQPKHSKR